MYHTRLLAVLNYLTLRDVPTDRPHPPLRSSIQLFVSCIGIRLHLAGLMSKPLFSIVACFFPPLILYHMY